MGMFKAYFKLAYRNIIRNKVFSLINILGLALGIVACLVIFLITSYDFGFDRQHPDGDRIFRIVGEAHRPSGESIFINTVFKPVAAFENVIPGFEAKTGFHMFQEKVAVPQSDGTLKEFSERMQNEGGPSGIITGPQYFEVFKYQWMAGNAASLGRPFTVVLTESEARKFFGPGQPVSYIGRRLVYADSLSVNVSGIVKDRSFRSDFAFRNFISISSATHSFLKNNIPTEDWTSLSPHRSYAFVKLSRGVKPEQINALFAKYIKEQVKPDPWLGTIRMYLQPITDIHFTPEFHRGDDGDNQFRKAYLPVLYALMGVAVFILLLAIVNFINLSTAQSMQRTKEVGVRKVLGSGRKAIVFQFLFETFVLTWMAAILSVLLIKPVMSLFHSFIPEGVQFSLTGQTVFFLLGIVLLTTVLAGLYPAGMFSAFRPIDSLKGNPVIRGGQKWYLRKSLIVFQFAISFLFMISALVIRNQIRFMQNSYKGFSTDAIVVLPPNWNDHEGKTRAFVKSLNNLTDIRAGILEAFPPMGFAHMGGMISYEPNNKKDIVISIQPGDEGRVPFYDMKFLAGRNLLPSDSAREVLINATCAKTLGFTSPEKAIGQFIQFNRKRLPIAGVVADYFENSFREPIKPMIMANMPEQEKSVSVKLATTGKDAMSIKNTMAKVEKRWKQFFPASEFDYHFLDESITWLYDEETNTAWLVTAAMIITIFISCMGIFGLALFTAERRTKEIGIRKVLGASVLSITRLLTKEFILLVLLAFAVAAPVGWYFMNQWLNDFSFRIKIDWTVFALAICGALFLAITTVSFRAIKAALANPVHALRSD
jgi:putative ABC transport system permease protein